MDRQFRTDVEGLRGIAVLAVVLYHAFPTLALGGFIGVDVFFVISGFVITRVLLTEHATTQKIDLLGFWTRRIRRILPAATLVLLTISAVALALPSIDPRELGRHLVGAALFYYNLRLITKSVSYLDSDHSQNPILHYWSLAVEEQFYLVWPLLVAAAVYKLRTHQGNAAQRIGCLALWLSILSFAYSVAITQTGPGVAFFSPLSRGWQFLVGAILACLEKQSIRKTGSLRALVSVFSLLALLLCAASPIGRFGYPGLAALLPTLSAAALIHTAVADDFVHGQVLSHPLLRFFGRISYSLYLWHWPFLIFGYIAFGKGTLATVGLIAFAMLAAAITYECVEKPILGNRALKASPRQSLALGAALMTVGAGSAAAMRFFAPDAVPIGNGAFLSGEAIYRDRPAVYNDGCLVGFAGTVSPACEYGAIAGKHTVVLLGDSHAANWFAALEAASKSENWKLVVRIKASCRPLDVPQERSDGLTRPYPECKTWLHNALNDIERIKPDAIIVAGTRHGYPEASERAILTRLAAIAATRAMRDTPWFPESSQSCLRRLGKPDACQWPLSQLVSTQTYPISAIESLSGDIQVFDLTAKICPNGICRAVQDQTVVMYDNHHFTESYSRRFSPDFAALLKTLTSKR